MALPQSPFDAIAEVYERVRPSYPDALFDALFAELPAQPEVLEIGAGTGKATASLLQRGARVTAVELGPNMAALLARKFAGAPNLHVIQAAFEQVQLPAGSFDALVSATAFHWLDPAVRLVKAHHVLRPKGVLCVVDTNQVRSEADRGYFDRSQVVYQRFFPGEDPPDVPEPASVRPAVVDELEASPLFEDVRLLRFPWDQMYSTADYADLVRSYSNTQQMENERAEALIADLCALIDAEFDGYVVRPLVITATLARSV
jgi:SAM-dependent methyltransferase